MCIIHSTREMEIVQANTSGFALIVELRENFSISYLSQH